MNFDVLKYIGSGAKMMSLLPLNFLLGKAKGDYPIRTNAAWDEEKDDILERANWLCEQVIKTPEELIADVPSMIGEEYQGEWAIYSCSMLAHALANISKLYPNEASKCTELIAKLIDIVNTPAMRKYDTMQWKEDAMDSLDGKKSHMTYLSILAWMICNFKMIGGDDRYDEILHKLCATLVRRMHESKYDLNLLSFPRKQIWLPDMLVAIVALKNYSRLYNGKYNDTATAWLINAKTKWIHKQTGLLAGMLPGESRYQKGIAIRGSHTALICSYLTMVDADFARDQYERMKKVFYHETDILGTHIIGLKEYQRKLPNFSMKAGDAGLIIKGISAGAIAFGFGAPTYFGDWEFRSQLLRTAEVASGTVKEKGKRHYRMAEMFLVGEATVLAMRTNIKR